MTVALDTNVLAYAEGVNGPEKKEAALAILDRLSPETGWLPTQALGELFNVLVRKAGFSRDQARVAILSWRAANSGC